jgi:RHS repeat-associated protein
VADPWVYSAWKLDVKAGLYYYKNRYYEPVSGRFLRRDLLGYGDGPNLYSYAGGNPAVGKEPLGLMAVVLRRPDYGPGPRGPEGPIMSPWQLEALQSGLKREVRSSVERGLRAYWVERMAGRWNGETAERVMRDLAWEAASVAGELWALYTGRRLLASGPMMEGGGAVQCLPPGCHYVLVESTPLEEEDVVVVEASRWSRGGGGGSGSSFDVGELAGELFRLLVFDDRDPLGGSYVLEAATLLPVGKVLKAPKWALKLFKVATHLDELKRLKKAAEAARGAGTYGDDAASLVGRRGAPLQNAP